VNQPQTVQYRIGRFADVLKGTIKIIHYFEKREEEEVALPDMGYGNDSWLCCARHNGESLPYPYKANISLREGEPCTLEGIEAANMMRKGQVKRLARSGAMGRTKFGLSLCQIAA
jgi:hypothetical protein